MTTSHFQLPIADLNWRLAIDNWQLTCPLFVRFAVAGAQRSSLIALAQLSVRAAALQSLFIRTQSRASVYRQHAFDFSVRTRNHVHADQLSPSPRRSRACISRRFNRTNIAAHK